MRPLFVLLVLAAPLAAEPRPANLVVDGIPEIPRRVSERSRPYENARGALLLDWDPAGDGVLIATRFAETAQVHRVARPGGARRQLTFFAEPVSEALYAPSRKGGFFFRMDTGGGEFYQYSWFDLATGAHTLITDGKSRHEGLLAAHGGKLALVGTARNGTDFDLYVADEKEPGALELVKELAGQWTPLDWSPDDQRLLLRRYFSINESHLFVFDLASGALTAVNEQKKKIAYGSEAVFSHDGRGVYYSSDEDSEFLRLTRYDLASGKKQVLTPKLDWDVDGLELSRDGAWLAYTANEGGASALYLARATEPLAARRVELPVGVVSRLKFDRQSKRLGFTLSTAQSTADVYSVDLKTRALTRWTESEVGGLDPSRFVAPERVRFPSFDGRTMDAWYYRPRAAAKKLPVVVSIHGGPEAQATAAFNPTVQYWVNELGVAVVQPNVRGSAGYGKSFLLLDNGARREDSVKDIGALLDWIATRPELDAERVAVYGGSYGGYMVLASLEHFASRLRCGVEVVGISSFVTFLEHTESYRRDLRRAEYGDERDPEMRKLLTAISPMTSASKITAPLFVAQGQNDPRVPASEAEQIVKAVRAGKGPVWYLLAKDEGHGFQKKANRDYFTDAVTRFLEEFLLK